MSHFDYTFYVESRLMCLELDCVLNYKPESGDGWSEPHVEASATLVSAKVGGIDIKAGLTKKQVQTIERDAMVWRADDIEDRRTAVAVEAYESRAYA